MKKYIVSIVLLFAFGLSFSQSKKNVLLTVDGKPVYISEFKRVYNKNLDLVKDESQKSVDGYMDLFVDYKLKIAEAYSQGIHENMQYKKEFKKYKNRLSRNYLYEDKVSMDLISEAYQRGLEEINVNHILIRANYEALPVDTLKAYNKIKDIYNRAKAGEDFEILAKAHSEEPKAAETAGSLGYFSAFSMVYAFETMAYNTKVGEVSEIVRTQFGYHILKINDRRKRSGLLMVSHIMIADNDKERGFKPEERILELKGLIEQGESFESIAKQYSDDKNSGRNGGELNKFRRGDLRAPEFEDAAFKLEKVGDVSEPIKTKFGWHLIKLNKKPVIETFEQRREFLKDKIKNGDRSKIVTSALSSKIKDKYGYEKINDHMMFFESYLGDEIFELEWTYDTLSLEKNKVIFTIGDRELRYNDFGSYIFTQKRRHIIFKEASKLITTFYDEFETDQLKLYFMDNLETENEGYAATIDEYRSGLLIFDVMNKNIWEKAKNDSIGLQAYFDETQDNYRSKESVKGVIISATNMDVAKQAEELLRSGMEANGVKESLNKGDKVNAIVSSGAFEKGERELPNDLKFNKGVSDVYPHNNRFVVVRVDEVLPARVKALDEVKGKVISDYQNHLETKWMEGLRRKYKVEVNKKALKKVKKALRS